MHQQQNGGIINEKSNGPRLDPCGTPSIKIQREDLNIFKTKRLNLGGTYNNLKHWNLSTTSLVFNARFRDSRHLEGSCLVCLLCCQINT